MDNQDKYLLVEKYRPTTIEECILPKHIKDNFKGYLQDGNIQSLLLSGPPGTGKTTVAKALCNELGCPYIVLNGSVEGRTIDILRTSVKNFAFSKSMYGNKKKIILIDESDSMTKLVQDGLRSFIEASSDNCSFIFTCNHKHKMTDAIISRCADFDFVIPDEDRGSIAKLMFERSIEIMDKEGIKYEKGAVADLVKNYFPSYRDILKNIQKFSKTGSIDSSVIIKSDSDDFKALIESIKIKNFKEVKAFVSKYPDDFDSLIKLFYESASGVVDAESIPTMILIMAEFQYKHGFVTNKEVNMLAMFIAFSNLKFL